MAQPGPSHRFYFLLFKLDGLLPSGPRVFGGPVGKSPIKKNHSVKRVRLRLIFKQVLAFVMTSGSVTDGDNADTEMTRMGSASQGEDSPRRFTKPTR